MFGQMCQQVMQRTRIRAGNKGFIPKSGCQQIRQRHNSQLRRGDVVLIDLGAQRGRITTNKRRYTSDLWSWGQHPRGGWGGHPQIQASREDAVIRGLA